MYSTPQIPTQEAQPVAPIESLFPITPNKNIGSPSDVRNLPSSTLRPEAQAQIKDLKRNASDLSDSSGLTTLHSMVSWKDAMLALERQGLEIAISDLKNQWKTSRNEKEQAALDKEIEATQARLESVEHEHMVVKLNKIPMSEDVVDVAWMGEIMVNDMYMAWLASSAEGVKDIRRQKKSPRGDFKTWLGHT
ncbi:MAG: hypothetical protein HETSPECPRED_002565 [Heterodermia speciosa]|uniref:Uncharacterized protein n=1 Tax=Heterodermia speciosa TaxID=116794 RepID=A0A8H3EY68_9LECA|nr:MAG: hypothetical protein HETSPECPRED_002565 [Heterodermia speciosa]